MARWSAAEDVLTRFVGDGSRKGSSWFGRAGDIVQQPPVWGGLAAVLAMGGPRGRRAALRGGACYVAAAAVANLVVKPFMRRGRPSGAGKRRLGPVTSSFPSGHAATDLAFCLGAAQELPMVLVPLSGATLAAHWSLVRSKGHYASDILVGGAIGVGVALAAWRLWPPGGSSEPSAGDTATVLPVPLPGGPPGV